MQPRTVTVAHNDGYSDLAAVYDYIVIGAGSASCVVARRLIDGSDARVLLIEAGTLGRGVATLDDPARWIENFVAPLDWAYRSAPTEPPWSAEAALSPTRRSCPSLRSLGRPGPSMARACVEPRGCGREGPCGDRDRPSVRGWSARPRRHRLAGCRW